MTFKGRIKNGVVVFDEPLALPEGAEVVVRLAEINPPDPAPAGDKPRKTLAERFKKVIGIFDDLPPDFSEQHDHYIHGTPKK